MQYGGWRSCTGEYRRSRCGLRGVGVDGCGFAVLHPDAMALFAASGVFAAAAVGQVWALRDGAIRVSSWDAFIVYGNPLISIPIPTQQGEAVSMTTY